MTIERFESDPTHSSIAFWIRHMVVAKVRGHFKKFDVTIELDEKDVTKSRVDVKIDAASIDTGVEQRDNHLRSPDFFDVGSNPVMTYRSTGLRANGDGYVLEGELTLHGVTRPVPLNLELNCFIESPMGTRAGFSASGEISRKDFGIEFNMPLEGGGVVVGDKVTISLEVEGVLRSAS